MPAIDGAVAVERRGSESSQVAFYSAPELQQRAARHLQYGDPLSSDMDTLAGVPSAFWPLVLIHRGLDPLLLRESIERAVQGAAGDRAARYLIQLGFQSQDAGIICEVQDPDQDKLFEFAQKHRLRHVDVSVVVLAKNTMETPI